MHFFATLAALVVALDTRKVFMLVYVAMIIASIAVVGSASAGGGTLPPSITMEFRLNAAVFNRDSVATEIAVFPVEVWLVDRDTKKFLIGPQGVFDDNYRFLYPDNQIIVYGSAHRDRKYRLFLRPSPEFWCPGCTTPGFIDADSDLHENQDFLILGVLILRDDEYVYSYPASAESIKAGERLEFNRVRDPERKTALGFTAYVDFDTKSGLIHAPDGDEDTPLVMKIDATASGHETHSGSFGKLRAGSRQ